MSLLILTLLCLASALQFGRFLQAAGKLSRQIVETILPLQQIVNRLYDACVDATIQLRSALFRTPGMLVPVREFAQRYVVQLPKWSLQKPADRHFSMQFSLSHRGVAR